jgi:polyferredoxin
VGSAPLYQSLADAVLVLHFGVVVFVVGGLAAIVTGSLLRWRWVNDRRFRLAHLACIGIVVAEAWMGWVCPLTALESRLRIGTGSSAYTQSFVEHLVQRLLYYEAPSWVFTLAYTLFGLLVLAAWWYFPPGLRSRQRDNDA